MQADDEPAFRDLYAGMRAAELARTEWPPDAKREFCDQQYTLQDRHYRAHYAQFMPLAICVADSVVGRFYLGQFDRAMIVMDIIVTPRMQRHGIATVLMEAVTRHADAGGIDTRLHVEPDNPVRALYARLGFAAVGEPGIYLEMSRRAG